MKDSRFMSCPGKLLVAAFLLPLSGGAAKENPPGQRPPITFRVEGDFIEVAAVFTDSDGDFVPGLRVDDFELLEDGKPQEIRSRRLL